MLRPFACLSLCIPLLAACGYEASDADLESSAQAIVLSPAASASILALVNYPGADVNLLHSTIGLDVRAARGIVGWRAGPDAIEPTSDDRFFATIAQLEALPYLADTAVHKLQLYAAANPAPSPESVEGVQFAGWESQAVVWGVNDSDQASLRALLGSRAATNLVAARPFSSVAAIGAVAYVGPATLGKLHGQAPSWWQAMRSNAGALAGTFDSVTFDEPTAETALAIANQATATQLTAHGVASSPASHLIAARPYTTLAQVAATSGIGTATMTALRTYAQSGQWSPPQCIATFNAAVSPHLPDLLFMSESDRPLDIVSFPGAGTTAPTAASVLALVPYTPGSTTEVRPVANYYSSFEPASGTADPNAAALVQAAVTAQLTDVIYVAVIPAMGSPNQCEVDVYLVGRTSCGDLVGLHAIAIET